MAADPVPSSGPANLNNSRQRGAGNCGRLALLLLLAAALLVSAPGSSQTGSSAGGAAGDSSAPDAPSASKPPSSFPLPPVSPRNSGVPESTPPPAATGANAPASASGGTPPGGTATSPQAGSARDDLFRLTKQVNFVQVPVTVKDQHGFLVPGLLRQDFTVYENGVEQKISFFTSDPFPLSAAVIVDLSMPEVELQKVQKTLSALVGAFSDYDEVSLYTYGSTVRQMQDFTAASGSILSAAIDRLKREQGRSGGVPVVGGPLGQPAPTINGRSIDPTVSPGMGPVYRPEPHVLNDAVLQASLDLAKREPTRRRVVFLISEGREYGSKANVNEVLKVMLSNQISLYAVGVGSSALPGYGQLEKINVPGSGAGDILPRYASATGGQVYAELSQSDIEDAYNRITREARNQYTLGYTTRATLSSAYRSIEVVVHRPNLKVYARDGYYPLPPRSQ